jgi:hypothetical protein
MVIDVMLMFFLVLLLTLILLRLDLDLESERDSFICPVGSSSYRDMRVFCPPAFFNSKCIDYCTEQLRLKGPELKEESLGDKFYGINGVLVKDFSKKEDRGIPGKTCDPRCYSTTKCDPLCYIKEEEDDKVITSNL